MGWRPSPSWVPSAEGAPTARLVPSSTDVASAEGFRTDLAHDPSIPSNDARPAGDEIDVRMAEDPSNLCYAAMRHLRKCVLAAEWVHHAEAKLSVVGQPVHQTSRRSTQSRPYPSRACAALRTRGNPCSASKVPDTGDQDCRNLAGQGCWAEAAGVDNIQSALLAVARERSLEAQSAWLEIAARKAMPRRK